MLLDRGAGQDGEYVVTERILDFHSLRAWLEKVAIQAPLSAPSTPPPVSSQLKKPGSFTKQVLALSDTRPTSAPQPMPAAPPTPTPPAVAAPAVSAPTVAPPPALKAALSNKALILILVVLVIAALALVGYCALKR
jgi:hypothetical protein